MAAMKFSPSNMIKAATMGFLLFAQANWAFGQVAPPEKSQKTEAAEDSGSEQSQALLQKVKESELQRRIAIKQTEIDRLKEDLEKSNRDLDGAQKDMDATTLLIAASSANMDKLGTERKRLEQQLDLTDLRIEAEQKVNEGLKRLFGAQSSELEAINQRMAEIDVRSHLRQSEVELLSAGKPVPGEDNDENGSPDFYKLKKTLSSDEMKSVSAETIARAAMKAASLRLESAQEAAARVKEVDEGMTQANLAPVAEKKGGTTTGSQPAVSTGAQSATWPGANPAASPAVKHHSHRKSASPKASGSPSPQPAASPTPKANTKSAWWQRQWGLLGAPRTEVC
jgi:uncharacterized small protein (DUF1192 family)